MASDERGSVGQLFFVASGALVVLSLAIDQFGQWNIVATAFTGPLLSLRLSGLD